MKIKAPVKVAVIGCGLIGQWHHIPSLCKIKDAKLVAICDKNPELVKRVAQKFNISRCYTDSTEMFDREKLDMVDICTPPQSHSALSIQAMDKGCHVLVEKPITLSLKEFDELKSVAKSHNVKLCQVHNKLFEPIMIKALSMVSQGDIGDLVGLDIQVLQSWARVKPMLMNKEHWCHSLPAGIVSETLPHPIYLAAAFVGTVELVETYIGKSSGYDWVVADEIRLILKGDKGVGIISYLHNSAQSKTIIDIHGTKKHLRIDLFNSVITEYGAGTGTRSSRAAENINQSFSILTNTIFSTFSVISGRFYSGHYTLIRKFIESIQNNSEPPVTLREARDVIAVMEKVAARI